MMFFQQNKKTSKHYQNKIYVYIKNNKTRFFQICFEKKKLKL